MNRKKSILISLTGITVVMLALLGLTYGYYITNIIGNTNSNSISIDTKDLKLVYNDGTEDLVFGAIEPGWTNSDEPKVFTVNNTGKSNIDEYAVGIDEVINTLNRTEDLVYTITCKSYKFDDYEDDGVDATESGVCRGDSGEFPKENSLILTNQIDSGYIHVYEMVISYKYLDDVNQSEDMGASVGGRIQIYTLPDTIDITGTVTGYSEGDYVEISTPTKTSQIVDGKYKLIGVEPGNHTLSIKYLDDNDVVQTRSSKQISIRMGEEAGIDGNTITMNSTSGNVTININGSSSSLVIDITGVNEQAKLLKDVIINNIQNGTLEGKTTFVENLSATGMVDNISSASDKILSTADDDYTATTGKPSYYFRGNPIDNYVEFAGMCWRIVRIQGDGSIKLILASELSCSETNLTSDSGYATKGARGVKGTILKAHYGYKMIGDNYINDYINSPEKNSTSARTQLNAWLDRKITSEEQENYLKDENWCIGDLTNAYSFDDTGEIVGNVDQFIESWESFYYTAGNKYWVTKIPSYICETTGKDGEVDTNKVGMLTFDEIVYAGGGNDSNSYYYLNNNATTNYWWSLSPDYFDGDMGSDFSFVVDVGDGVEYGPGSISNRGLRVAVSLKSSVVFKDGVGTLEKPYILG